jgi:8-oxo-dGTP pyrophosphatase MutT (NUDIX family)
MAESEKVKPQSAVLPYRRRKAGLEIMLVTSLDTGRWVLPKGNVESGLTPCESAQKEAYEEAGIRGKTEKKCFGTFTYLKTEKKGGGMREVEVFPMEVTEVLDDWPEKSDRKREWMVLDKAAESVMEKKLKKLLKTFGDRMAETKEGS